MKYRTLPNLEGVIVQDEWTNGAKANVVLLKGLDNQKIIRKEYHEGEYLRLIREFLILIYLKRKLPTIPKVINIDLKNKTMHLTFVEGERALEWVLKRYGTKGLNVAQFKSFHGLDTNPIVASAFAKLKSSTDKNAKCFKKAIKLAYEEFHNLNFAHGDPSPRNLIYDGKIIHLIDFDRTRLSFNPQAIDRKQLSHWYDL